MTRKQAEIPGFERQIENAAVEEAAITYYALVRDRSALSKKEKAAQLTLEATMRAHNLLRYEYQDDDGEILVAKIVEGATKAVIEKTGEAESEIGTAVEPSGEGLLADAAKVQRDAGVAVDEGGDVVPIDSAVPRTPKKGKRR